MPYIRLSNAPKNSMTGIVLGVNTLIGMGIMFLPVMITGQLLGCASPLFD